MRSQGEARAGCNCDSSDPFVFTYSSPAPQPAQSHMGADGTSLFTPEQLAFCQALPKIELVSLRPPCA